MTSAGFEGLGSSAVSDLVENGFNSIEKIIETAARGNVEDFSRIEGFGEIMARLIILHFTDPQNLALVDALKKIGLHFQEEIKEPVEMEEQALTFKHQVWVITGSFERFSPRSKAAEEIEKRGGKVTDSVSSKTTHLLAGNSPGSKLEKAKKLNVLIIDETAFLEMLK
jgi:DNA ligase (NAD+)